MAATELVRRAEIGIGRAVRQGQQEGRYFSAGQTERRPGHAGSDATRVPDVFAHQSERRDIYALADAPDEQVDAAITEAKVPEHETHARYGGVS